MNTEARKEKVKQALRKSYCKHRVKRIAEARAWALANPEKAKAASKKSTAKYIKKYPERRKETYRKSRIKRRVAVNAAYRKYCANRKKVDPTFKMSKNINSSIRRAFNNQGAKKNSKSALLLGMPVKEFQIAMEKLFWPGMSYKNRHKWQLDHIRPCADFDLTDPEQQKQCFHWNNWQPLWADDNGIKSDRLDWTPYESRHSLPERLKPAPFIMEDF